MKQAAVFLDRDNTIIEDPGYLADPNAVRLIKGAADAIRRFNEAGYRVVVVSNQSGIARGLLTEPQLDDIHAQLELMLENERAHLDRIYYCPYLEGSEAIVGKYRRKSSLRKPQPGMLKKAAKELTLELEHCWMIGDSSSDVLAGHAAGCRTILLAGNNQADEKSHPDFVAPSLGEAANIVLNGASHTEQLKREPEELHQEEIVQQEDVEETQNVEEPEVQVTAEQMPEATRAQDEQEMDEEIPEEILDVERELPTQLQKEDMVQDEGESDEDLEPTDTPPAAEPTPFMSEDPSPFGQQQRNPQTPDDEVLDILRDIRTLIQQQRRDANQRDFSLARLGATLFQIVAIASLLWGISAMLEGANGLSFALTRFALAGVVQLIALTLYSIDRLR